jgi:mannose/fructose/N-acetylgalactosamine-specific phosphotransferase system component IID
MGSITIPGEGRPIEGGILILAAANLVLLAATWWVMATGYKPKG